MNTSITRQVTPSPILMSGKSFPSFQCQPLDDGVAGQWSYGWEPAAAQRLRFVRTDSPAVAEKLRRATPHWMRHTHATHALQGGAELTAVRDNLRHASLSTTSMYLHSGDVKRARQMAAVPRLYLPNI